MNNYEMCFPQFVTLREKPEIAEKASEWFHSKWFVPMEAYRECMEAYLSKETEYGWYLCLENEKIYVRSTRKKLTGEEELQGGFCIWRWKICGPKVFRRCI